jgi:hypothetical protein
MCVFHPGILFFNANVQKNSIRGTKKNSKLVYNGLTRMFQQYAFMPKAILQIVTSS